MALLTIQIGVCAGQRELALVMIEAHMIPARGVMTGGTILPKLPIVLVILLVARITIYGCPFELFIYMAGLTGYVRMTAFQFKRGKIVIELGRRPAIRGMALAAIHAKATLVRIVSSMAGVAILQRRLEIAKETCIYVTLHTGKSDMLSGYFE